MGLNLEGFNELAGISDEIDQAMVEKLKFDGELEIPHQFTDLEIWNNYCDERLYVLDKEVRKFLKTTQYKRDVKHGMKTAVPLVFHHIFGRKANHTDSQTCVMLHRLLKYYCTKYTGTTKIGGNRVTRVYYFSRYAAQLNKKRPLSIRLRLEEGRGGLSEPPCKDKRAKRR